VAFVQGLLGVTVTHARHAVGSKCVAREDTGYASLNVDQRSFCWKRVVSCVLMALACLDDPGAIDDVQDHV